MDLPAFEWLWNVVGPLCFNASPRILDSLVRLSGTLSGIGSGVDAACGRTAQVIRRRWISSQVRYVASIIKFSAYLFFLFC